MNKRICCLLFCLPLMLAAKSPNDFSIRGVDGKILTNIQSRLQELSQTAPLNSKSNEELSMQIAQAMSPYGYFNPDIRISRTEDNSNLRININPGQVMRITSMTISINGEGKLNPRINSSLHKLPIRQGMPFDSMQYEGAKQSLLNAAEYEGYLHASFSKAEILIDKKNNTMKITLVFNTGPRYYFGQVRFNPTYISPQLLHRYIPFRHGQTWSTEQLTALNNALSGSGYFSSVVVQPQLNSDTHIPIDVNLQPAAPVSYSLGLGYGTDTGPRGRVGYNVVPVNPYGHKFSALALGSLSENRLQTQYLIPGKNPVTDQYSFSNSFSTLNYNVGYSNSLLFSLAQRHEVANFQRMLSINALYERFNYQRNPGFEALAVFPKGSLTWMKKSSPLFSPNGYRVTLSGLAARNRTFSNLSFAQAVIDAKAAITLSPIGTRLLFHTTQGLTKIDDIHKLPISLALLLGGTDNLKAYNFNSLGPGKTLSYAGLEIQKETAKNWYLLGFFDAGNVYKPSAKNLLYDVGGGVMWVSPVGPIKIGVAQAVDDHLRRFEKRGPKLIISMGPDL